MDKTQKFTSVEISEMYDAWLANVMELSPWIPLSDLGSYWLKLAFEAGLNKGLGINKPRINREISLATYLQNDKIKCDTMLIRENWDRLFKSDVRILEKI